MALLIVDDSPEKRGLLVRILKKEGKNKIYEASSSQEAFSLLEKVHNQVIKSSATLQSESDTNDIQLILMDIVMPEETGIEALSKLKSHPVYKNIPVIMITASNDEEDLQKAFEYGANDFINTNPIRSIELLSRMRSTLKLKEEMDRRIRREQELIETTRKLNIANEFLQKLSIRDALTNLFNRRFFDDNLKKELSLCYEEDMPLSLLMIDVDHFKNYNDTYGHQQGDQTLKKVGQCLQKAASRTRDLACRYGGEEFSLILPHTDKTGALVVAKALSKLVLDQKIEHSKSTVGSFVTISIGISTTKPKESLLRPETMIQYADYALYKAKESGRNTAKHYTDLEPTR